MRRAQKLAFCDVDHKIGVTKFRTEIKDLSFSSIPGTKPYVTEQLLLEARSSFQLVACCAERSLFTHKEIS
jgi:hypothetical protein